MRRSGRGRRFPKQRGGGNGGDAERPARDDRDVSWRDVKPPADARGARPLLEPKDVLLSTSYYLDIGKFWENRAKLFNEKNLKEFEEFVHHWGYFHPFLCLNRLVFD